MRVHRAAVAGQSTPQSHPIDTRLDEPVDPLHFALPVDVYRPRMRTTSENLPTGAASLRDGWEMCVADSRPAADDPGWKSVCVPSQWAVTDPALFSHGGSVWYRTSFRVQPKDGRHLALDFRGVDYEAEVYLNGERLGDHEGCFLPFGFDLDGKVLPRRPNELLVKVSAPADPGGAFFKQQIKGVFGHHDCRPGPAMGLQTPTSTGTTGGIWNDVLVRETGPSSLRAAWVDTDLSDDHARARLTFHTPVENHQREPRDVVVETRWRPESAPDRERVVRQRVRLVPGMNEVTTKATEHAPCVWWTRDRGEPALYRVETRILHDGEVEDEQRGHFGIRRIAYDAASGRLELNGQPLFQRGVNYIPTQWLSTYDADAYARDVGDMVAAGLNCVRVHAHVLPHEFHDAADRAGLLVWADFPLIWGTAGDAAFQAKATTQLSGMINELRRHPSIFLWNAHNESLPHDATLDRVLDRTAALIDPSRGHKEGSGMGEHYYPGWYFPPWGGSYTTFNDKRPALASELGTVAVPRSLLDFVPDEARWPPSEHADTWKAFDFQAWPSRVNIGPWDSFKDIDDYVTASQQFQSDYVKYLVEHCRRLRFAPSTGVYPFMFKDAWPSACFGVRDHAGTPKMAWEAMSAAMHPTLASIEWTDSKVKAGGDVRATLWLVNDLGRTFPDASVRWRVYRADDDEKRALLKGSTRVDVAPDSSLSLCGVRWRVPPDATPGQRFVLDMDWRDAAGEPLSSNAVAFTVASPSTSVPERFGLRRDRYIPVQPEYPPPG